MRAKRQTERMARLLKQALRGRDMARRAGVLRSAVGWIAGRLRHGGPSGAPGQDA